MKRLIGAGLFVTVVLLMPAASAEALVITPDSGVLGDTMWTGEETGTGQALEEAEDECGCDLGTLQYTSNVDDGTVSGPLAGSYETTFSNTPDDPADAVISYVGGSVVSGQTYLFVKDGNNDPAWYLFDLTALGWDGTEELDLRGFWPSNGAISHVTFFGGSTSVPEPATLSLLGMGLLGLAAARRRTRNL